MAPLPPYVFAMVYLAVDIAYVTLSQPVYNRAVRNISGRDISFEKPGAWAAAVLAYASMAIAWLLLVVPAVSYMISRGMAKWAAGLVAGFVYGLALYGVFNGTLYAMFAGWDLAISARDMLWGISWATMLTVAFAVSR